MYVAAMKPKPPNRTGYLLLEALASGRQHGYALAKRVDSDTDGEVRLGAGSLYSNLDRLLAAGLIEEAGAEVVEGRNRRYYQLTGNGRSQPPRSTSARCRPGWPTSRLRWAWPERGRGRMDRS